MALSNKLRAEYAELINAQLDSIPIESLEDFELVQDALSDVIQPKVGYYSLPQKIQEQLLYIREFLETPESYVADERDYEEYKKIIRGRIQAKIAEFQSLSEPQKQDYIRNQQEQRKESAGNQKRMAQAQPPVPGSEAHTISESEWLAELHGITPTLLPTRLMGRRGSAVDRMIMTSSGLRDPRTRDDRHRRMLLEEHLEEERASLDPQTYRLLLPASAVMMTLQQNTLGGLDQHQLTQFLAAVLADLSALNHPTDDAHDNVPDEPSTRGPS